MELTIFCSICHKRLKLNVKPGYSESKEVQKYDWLKLDQRLYCPDCQVDEAQAQVG